MKHRGKHSSDDTIFAPKWHSVFKEAAGDLSFLLGKNYGVKSSLALVGNHYQLNKRQQRALHLITCPAPKIIPRKEKQLAASELANKSILIDGYNLLITIEAALSGGYVFVGQDGCHRDIASIHSTYKKVEETQPAIQLIHETIQLLNIGHVHWYFDSPVSNSGRLKTMLYKFATANNAPWDIDLVFNPDRTLVEKNAIAVTCDSWIIDETDCYFNLAGYIVERLPAANLLDFFSQ